MSERVVVIVGMYAPWTDPLPEGWELWGANRAYQSHAMLDRAYCIDPLNRFITSPERRKEFLTGLAAHAKKVYLQEHVPEIPSSQAYPLAAVLRTFGVAYFTSTIAYMIAHAILEGADRLIMHRIYCLPASLEYLSQKPCAEFWLGVAMGRGIQVETSDDSHLCRPTPWQPPMYAFNDCLDENYVDKMLASAAQIAMPIPVRFGKSAIADPLVAGLTPAVTRRPVPVRASPPLPFAQMREAVDVGAAMARELS